MFEEIINDGATRFAAVFHSQGVDTVGPVRSGRHPDIEILEAFDHPLFVWSGGNGGVTYYIERSELVDLSANHTSGYYRRTGRRGAVEPVHVERGDVVAHPGRLPRAAGGVRRTCAPASRSRTVSRRPTIDVTMDNIDVRWEYDADTGQYYRFQDGGPHKTENSGQVYDRQRGADDGQLPARARSTRARPTPRCSAPTRSYVFTGGTVRVGSWLRFASTDPYQFFDNFTDLNEIGLQPGRTWVELPRNIEGTVSWS